MNMKQNLNLLAQNILNVPSEILSDEYVYLGYLSLEDYGDREKAIGYIKYLCVDNEVDWIYTVKVTKGYLNREFNRGYKNRLQEVIGFFAQKKDIYVSKPYYLLRNEGYKVLAFSPVHASLELLQHARRNWKGKFQLTKITYRKARQIVAKSKRRISYVDLNNDINKFETFTKSPERSVAVLMEKV